MAIVRVLPICDTNRTHIPNASRSAAGSAQTSTIPYFAPTGIHIEALGTAPMFRW